MTTHWPLLDISFASALQFAYATDMVKSANMWSKGSECLWQMNAKMTQHFDVTYSCFPSVMSTYSALDDISLSKKFQEWTDAYLLMLFWKLVSLTFHLSTIWWIRLLITEWLCCLKCLMFQLKTTLRQPPVMFVIVSDSICWALSSTHILA